MGFTLVKGAKRREDGLENGEYGSVIEDGPETFNADLESEPAFYQPS